MGWFLAKLADANDEGVKEWLFGGPRGDFEIVINDLISGEQGCLNSGVGRVFGCVNHGAIGSDEFEAVAQIVGVLGSETGEGEPACAIGGKGGVYGVIPESGLGVGGQIDVAEDSGESPKVLALEVGSIGVAVDLDGEGVLSLFQEVGEVEFGRSAGVLRVSDFLPVAPKVEGRRNTVEGNGGLASFPTIGKREAFAIGGDGISFLVSREVLLRFAHDAGRIFFEGVGVVTIDRSSVALEFNIRWDRDGFPSGIVKIGLKEVGGAFFGMVDPVKLPWTV